MAYKVKRYTKIFTSETILKSVNTNIVYRIKKEGVFKLSYRLFENESLIAIIDKPTNWNKSEYLIETKVSKPFKLVGDIWGGQYRFIRNEEEFGIVSHKVWSSGEFGIAVKKGEHLPMVLSVVVLVALLRNSGVS